MTQRERRRAEIRRLLSEGQVRSQENLRLLLAARGFYVRVPQLSKDLTALGAYRVIDAQWTLDRTLEEEIKRHGNVTANN